MAQTETYNIFCFIAGEGPEFSVDIASNETVDKLKKKIKEAESIRFTSVDASQLDLYHLKISDNEDVATAVEQKLLEHPAKLSPRKDLTDVFKDGPKKTDIIIVQPRSIGSKRKHSELGTSSSDSGAPPGNKKKKPRLSDESHRQQAASALHVKAWGNPWPQSEGTIDKTEIIDETGSVDDEIHGLADKLEVPLLFNYRYFEGIRDLKSALGASFIEEFEDVLVFREEYKMLRQALKDQRERKKHAIVVTGHPGIGKSTFLFYLLLYRLEKKLPTAVQLSAKYYFIFDEQGAAVHPVSFEDMRLKKCWALTDSNDKVLQPCESFKILAELVILASSPKPERWKEWIKQANGIVIISDLPSVPEIAAIAKELRKRQIQLEIQPSYDPSSTLSLVRKWGPSTRNILRSMNCAAVGDNDPIQQEANSAVALICKSPSTILVQSLGKLMPQSDGSSVIFLRRTRNGGVTLSKTQTFIPTPDLLAIFEEQSRERSNKQRLDLFYALSSHALTRPAAGWIHERRMHERLCTDGEDLSIFRRVTNNHMRPSAHLLPGTLAGLKEADVDDSFYWIPSAANFPGIDSVLGNTDGHVYTIQATIASAHRSPIEGIRKVWKHFRPEVRIKRIWHYVVIADKKQTADEYAEQFSRELRDFTLGQDQDRVEVWGCTL